MWKDDPREHKRLLLAGMWSQELVVVKRSTIEEHTNHRYMALPWPRRVPLMTIDEAGQEKILRDTGIMEYGRLRKNGFPYADSHGMCVSGGGVEEGLKVHGSLAYELNLPEDATAKLGNWYCTDIEKIMVECAVLNPSGAFEDRLPGEEYHDVGQNPQIGSSIGATQHTQITRACITSYPIYQLRNRPQWCHELEAFVDVIQVGTEEDAFYVKLTTREITSEKICRMLHELRVGMMREFGGHNVDFNVKALADPNGGFVIIFGVIVQLTKTGRATTMNPDTGVRSEELDSMPIYWTDTCAAAGHVCLNTKQETETALAQGRLIIAKLYDYVRKVGARRYVRRFLLVRCGYVDGYGQTQTVERPRAWAVSKRTIFSSLFSYEGFRLTPTLMDCLTHSELRVMSKEEQEAAAKAGAEPAAGAASATPAPTNS
eukprot:TRINITY_DN10154_c0_g1_i4.p1 TRINITY_DN10154_c0_g1~~TRINITY_DN10154_c0_g1_i4.p1  ORF type:complete len:430 (+),score=76.09 TRINITY_DN10154_c0_g1_i4:181-1470(+)